MTTTTAGTSAGRPARRLDGYRSEYARWLAGFSDNFCRLVVQAVDERLRLSEIGGPGCGS